MPPAGAISSEAAGDTVVEEGITVLRFEPAAADFTPRVSERTEGERDVRHLCSPEQAQPLSRQELSERRL